MDVEVAIVGAGPVGCFLARELRAAGANVVVFEAQRARPPFSKALTMNCRSLEVLDMRGLLSPFLEEGATLPAAHFAALDTRLDLRALDTHLPYTLVLPQRRTEELLERAARELGAPIHFGHALEGFVEDEGGVTLKVAGGGRALDVRAKWVVGCDGARSTVRAGAAIPFEGTGTTMTAFQGDVSLAEPPGVPGVWNDRGGLLIVKQASGVFRVVVTDPTRAHVARDVPPTADELRDSLVRIAGTDFGLAETFWLSRFGNATRLAARYRKGRVLVAGDAAHVHFPAGGQGLNVGLQDAMNLGWRLARVARGRGPDSLLDGYHDERHAVGAALVANTRAQEALLGFTPQTVALRHLLAGVLRNADVNRSLAAMVTGLDVAYDAGEAAHPWAGKRMPNRSLSTPHGPTPTFTLLRSGRFVLLDGGLDAGARARTERAHAEDLDVVPVDLARSVPELGPARGVLLRPDGHVGAVLTSPA